MKAFKLDRLSLAIASALGLTGVAHAQLVINDTLTGASSSYNWMALNGACLTAGTSFTITSTNTIPACSVAGSNLSYYSGKTLVGGATGLLPDAIGVGALRLSNGDTGTGSNGNNQTGAIVSNFTFPSSEGLQVTWTSVTYGGNAYQNSNSNANGYNNLSGADGISFFLSDGGTPADPVKGTAAVVIPPTVGALGGSLGYSCSNGNGTYDGVLQGYLGIGMDEFGNFSSSSDNTSSGAPAGQTPGAIAVRGAGHTSWAWLNANYKAYYPDNLSGSDQATAVKTTCQTGNLYNFSGKDISVAVTPYYTADYTYKSNGNKVTGSISSATTIPGSSKCNDDGTLNSSGSHNCTYKNLANPSTQTVSTGNAIPSTATSPYQLDFNYPWITTSTFPTGTYIFNQEAAGTGTNGASVAVRASAPKITYSLLITQAGLATLTYSINSGAAFTVLNGLDIKASNGPLPKFFRFGFSAGTGGGSNVHEITCFKASPDNTSNSTAGSNVQSGRVQTDSQVYLAYYHAINSWGSLTAQSLLFTAAAGSTPSSLVVLPAVNWDAGCVLTGGACLSQAGATVNAPLTDGTRFITTWNGTQGVPFQWTSLTTGTGSQQAALTAGDTLPTSDRLNYLRGNRTKEVSNGGAFRNRTNLLGDIIDSSPVWVGPPNLPYSAAWADALYPATAMPEGTTYGTFATSMAGRENVVYSGTNDGMLHGFRAGFYSNGKLDQTTNDGQELMAYLPSQVVSTIHSTNTALDFSSPSYSHNFFVDASPSQGDLFYGGNWHTWVVGALGPGGQANGAVALNPAPPTPQTPDVTTVEVGSVFALDVTDPTTFVSGKEKALVKGEWSSASLNAGTCTGGGTKCGDHLGATYGTPLIRRLHDGTWGVIFGNGLNSKLGTAGLFIVHISPTDGSTKSVQFIDTLKGSSTAMNGIVQTSPVDLDGDHITDYVYAGDVQGNLWRFDLTSATATSWSVPTTPLFTTQSGQPITSGIAVDSMIPSTDKGLGAFTQPVVVVAFGTGEKLPKTLTSDTWYPSVMQSVYGIWDSNMAAWNAKAATQFQYASLSSPPTITAGNSASLQLHTIATDKSGNRTETASTSATVCWNGTTACSSGTNSQMGWELDLSVTPKTSTSPAVAEQVLFNPLIVSHFLNTNTDLPQVAQALTCDKSLQTEYSVGISMATGGAAVGIAGINTTDANGVTTFSYFTGTTVGTIGVATQATGTSSAVTASDGSQWLVFQKSDGTGGTLGISPPPGTGGTKAGERLNWTKMR